jgi:hypothetical protein
MAPLEAAVTQTGIRPYNSGEQAESFGEIVPQFYLGCRTSISRLFKALIQGEQMWKALSQSLNAFTLCGSADLIAGWLRASGDSLLAGLPRSLTRG